MNYRHIYHAGNFADVVKHVVLIAVLKKMRCKETPFQLLDTHAGIGHYDLLSIEAQKSKEFTQGITALYDAKYENLDDSIADYLKIIKNHNQNSFLKYYPGSPLIAKEFIRSQDQLILCELHPDDFISLRNQCARIHNISTHHLDAYLAMKAFLPPKVKRGVVLIDAPFEKTDEFDSIIKAIQRALKHWRNGIFMIWYPIKDHKKIAIFNKELSLLQTPYFSLEFCVAKPVKDNGLDACGITLLNPPWLLKENLVESTLPALGHYLQGKWSLITKGLEQI